MAWSIIDATPAKTSPCQTVAFPSFPRKRESAGNQPERQESRFRGNDATACGRRMAWRPSPPAQNSRFTINTTIMVYISDSGTPMRHNSRGR